MLSEERIKRIADSVFTGNCEDDSEIIDFARAIEAAVLPEGWVAVPKEPTLAMLDCLRSDITSNLEKRYQAMLAAAPKPAQAEKQEPFPFSADRVTYHKTAAIGAIMPCGTMVTNVKEAYEAGQNMQAVKQEPVKDEPVAWMVVTPYDKLIFQNASQAEHYAEKWELVSAPLYTRPQQEPVKDEPVAEFVEDESAVGRAKFKLLKPLKVGTKLYTRPQPDLTAEVEFMQGKYEEMLEEWLPQKQRIAELEEAAREARDALLKYQQRQSSDDLEYAGYAGDEALAKLDAVLGNAALTGAAKAD